MSYVSEKLNPHRPRYHRKDAWSHYEGTCLLVKSCYKVSTECFCLVC